MWLLFTLVIVYQNSIYDLGSLPHVNKMENLSKMVYHFMLIAIYNQLIVKNCAIFFTLIRNISMQFSFNIVRKPLVNIYVRYSLCSSSRFITFCIQVNRFNITRILSSTSHIEFPNSYIFFTLIPPISF